MGEIYDGHHAIAGIALLPAMIGDDGISPILMQVVQS